MNKQSVAGYVIVAVALLAGLAVIAQAVLAAIASWGIV